MRPPQIRDQVDLECELSRPSDADIAAMRTLEGDILILGAGGKMGPSLARLCRNAADAAGAPRSIFAVSRSVSPQRGIEAIHCDLLQRKQVARLPDCPNILYLAGRKFGSTGSPDLTCAMNTVAPANVAEKFPGSRVVVFSTGNVYPFREISSGGSVETDAPAPVGEYAQSCLGRERVFEHYSRSGLRCLFFRLNNAVDLRYGILVDIARKVHAGLPVELAVPAFNVIWQRDANSYALRCLQHCASPPVILNVTGPETLRVRETANWFAGRFNRTCRFEAVEGSTALLSNASACMQLLGKPQLPVGALMRLVADWVVSEGLR